MSPANTVHGIAVSDGKAITTASWVDTAYPVPVTPTPEPWWPWARLRARLTRTRTARLQQALDGYRLAHTLAALQLETERKCFEVERQLERVRTWNTQLLQEKHAWLQQQKDVEAALTAAHQTAATYLIERDEAQGRVRYLERELEDMERSRDELEGDLKTALDRAKELSTKLRERKR